MQDDIIKPPTTDTATSSQPVESAPVQVQDVTKSPEPAPVPSSPVQENPVSSSEVGSEKPEEAPEPPQEVNQQAPAKPKSGVPKMVIGFAGVICLALIGVVIYLAMNGGVEQKVGDAKTPASSQTQQQAANQNDLSSLSNEASTLPEPGSDPTSDLTDQALGL